VHSATPLVSIVIPCYLATSKQGELLDETLDTVAAQTSRDYEIVVVDDGSPLDPGDASGYAARTRAQQPRGRRSGRPSDTDQSTVRMMRPASKTSSVRCISPE
jgi:cellulose synthase/poly-beta-1,6-N-acetylglucosamine synthase-like glycosyltransferase